MATEKSLKNRKDITLIEYLRLKKTFDNRYRIYSNGDVFYGEVTAKFSNGIVSGDSDIKQKIRVDKS